MGEWFRKEIKSVEDLKGLKMRIPGFAGEVLARVGVAPTNIAPGELYTSLEKGVIDALEWVGPALDIKMGFHKIAPYYYTGWHEPATELQFLANKGKFDGLPKDIQAILKAAMRFVSYDMLSRSVAENGMMWQEIKKEHPEVKIMSFPADVIKAVKKANEEAIAEISAKDALFGEIIESQRAFIPVVREWTMMSDYTYLKNMQ